MAWLIFAVLGGCAHRAPPTVFPTPLVTTDPAPGLEVEAQEGDCVSHLPYAPGMEPPTCSGVLVPPVDYAELLHAEDTSTYFEGQAARCDVGRARDREHATALYGVCWDGWQETEKREAQLRAWVPLVLGLGAAAAFAGGYELGRLVP